jgi:hypothetical protein
VKGHVSMNYSENHLSKLLNIQKHLFNIHKLYETLLNDELAIQLKFSKLLEEINYRIKEEKWNHEQKGKD